MSWSPVTRFYKADPRAARGPVWYKPKMWGSASELLFENSRLRCVFSFPPTGKSKQLVVFGIMI